MELKLRQNTFQTLPNCNSGNLTTTFLCFIVFFPICFHVVVVVLKIEDFITKGLKSYSCSMYHSVVCFVFEWRFDKWGKSSCLFSFLNKLYWSRIIYFAQTKKIIWNCALILTNASKSCRLQPTKGTVWNKPENMNHPVTNMQHCYVILVLRSIMRAFLL